MEEIALSKLKDDIPVQQSNHLPRLPFPPIHQLIYNAVHESDLLRTKIIYIYTYIYIFAYMKQTRKPQDSIPVKLRKLHRKEASIEPLLPCTGKAKTPVFSICLTNSTASLGDFRTDNKKNTKSFF